MLAVYMLARAVYMLARAVYMLARDVYMLAPENNNYLPPHYKLEESLLLLNTISTNCIQ